MSMFVSLTFNMTNNIYTKIFNIKLERLRLLLNSEKHLVIAFKHFRSFSNVFRLQNSQIKFEETVVFVGIVFFYKEVSL